MFQVDAVFLTLIFHTVVYSGAFDVWWDILLSLYQKFTAKSVGERICENRLALDKVRGKNIVVPFFRTQCTYIDRHNHVCRLKSNAVRISKSPTPSLSNTTLKCMRIVTNCPPFLSCFYCMSRKWRHKTKCPINGGNFGNFTASSRFSKMMGS